MKRLKMNAPVIVVVLFALMVFCTPTQTPAQAPEKIVIGFIAPLTGPAAPWSLGCLRGGQYFLDQANAKGGVKVAGKNYTFEVKSYDHTLDPAKAVEHAKRAIFTDKANALVLRSTLCVLPILPMATENKLVNFHASMGRKVMSPEWLYSFRTCQDSIMSEAATFRYAKEKLNLKTVVSILADDETGWEGFRDLREAAEMTGVKILGSEYYIRGTKDFYPILGRALARKPDFISFAQDSPGDCYLIIKQAYELGFKGLLTGSAPLSIPQLKKGVPEEALGQVALVTVGAVDLPEYTTPEEKEMKRVMVEKYGKGGQLYDMDISLVWVEGNWASLYIQAIQKADSFDAEKVTKVIESGKFPMLGREVQFGGKKLYGNRGRSVLIDYTVVRIVNGEIKVEGVYKGSAE
jgi:branched-chain amino acid transport system substrate-binding protein